MDTSHLTRHVGKLANTDQRVVVAFMQIREKPDHALVIAMDNMPARTEQAVMDVLHTPEGQQPTPFALVLGRHLMPDTGETIMQALHRQGKLMAVPVHNVLMLPAPNMPMRLSTILEQQGLMQQHVNPNYETEKFNPHLNNQRAESSENARAIARTLIMEAEDLEAIARGKRSQAYAKDPSLKQSEKVTWTAPTQPMDRINPWTAVPNVNAAPEVIPFTQVDPFTDAVTASLVTTEATAPVNPLEERLERLEMKLNKMLEPAEPKASEKKKQPTTKEKLTEDATPVNEG